MKHALLVILASVIAAPVYADIQVQFLEGAPKDRFVITNKGECEIDSAQFKIDFSGSDAGLIFDVTGSGAGVEVFQPFEVTKGVAFLASEPEISDGDQVAILSLTKFAEGQTIEFTIDVDDTSGAQEIIVSDTEIRGAIVSLSVGEKQFSNVMEMEATVLVGTDTCLS